MIIRDAHVLQIGTIDPQYLVGAAVSCKAQLAFKPQSLWGNPPQFMSYGIHTTRTISSVSKANIKD